VTWFAPSPSNLGTPLKNFPRVACAILAPNYGKLMSNPGVYCSHESIALMSLYCSHECIAHMSLYCWYESIAHMSFIPLTSVSYCSHEPALLTQVCTAHMSLYCSHESVLLTQVCIAHMGLILLTWVCIALTNLSIRASAILILLARNCKLLARILKCHTCM
jgi:hypothetical protein